MGVAGWLGDVAVLPPVDLRHANYRPAPSGHLFRTVLAGGGRWLLARCGAPDGEFEPEEQELAMAPDTGAGWAALGACAVEAHSGWRLLSWIGREAGERLREAEAAGQALPSRELEFALDAAARQQRIVGRGEWTSPEWRGRASAGPLVERPTVRNHRSGGPVTR